MMQRATFRMISPRRAFTLTELLVAVVVLLGVLIACSRIFNTTSQVTRVGQANADILQEAAAIEQLLRDDFRRLSTEGVFAIRNVAVRNDIHGSVLINPAIAPDAMVRADQLLYFVQGPSEVTTMLRFQAGDNLSGLGTVGRVYFGHAYQLGEYGLPAIGPPAAGVTNWRAQDVTVALKPWEERSFPSATPIPARFTRYSAAPFYQEAATADPIRMPRVDARRWILAREQIALADDDSTTALNDTSRIVFLRDIQVMPSIFADDPVLGANPVAFAGRVDAAASDLRQVRQRLLYRWNGTPLRPDEVRPWVDFSVNDDQWSLIADSLLNYPRAERRAPSMSRIDQALTSSVLGAACSSVRIEWTYADGTGAFPEATNVVDRRGVRTRPTTLSELRLLPWFGLRNPERRVYPYGDPDLPVDDEDRWTTATSIYPDNIERWDETQPLDADVRIYEAFFGFNRERGLLRNAAGELVPDFDLAYTPWPTAIRVTLTLHDAALALDAGREVQFVIELPRRAEPK